MPFAKVATPPGVGSWPSTARTRAVSAISYDPCMHMAHIAPHADRERLVLAAMAEENVEKRQKILHQLFDGYKATSDFPGCLFVDDLMDMYPDAAIILNQRNSADVWVHSIGNSLRFFGTLSYYLPTLLRRTDRLHYHIHQQAYKYGDQRFKNVYFFSAEFYDLHNQWVKDEAEKRGKTVVAWRPTDGWVPICKALGKDLPKYERPFPRLNEEAQVTMLKRILIARGLVSFALTAGPLWAAWKYGPGIVTSLAIKLEALF